MLGNLSLALVYFFVPLLPSRAPNLGILHASEVPHLPPLPPRWARAAVQR